MRYALIALTLLAFVSALIAAKYSHDATKVRNKLRPEFEQIGPGKKPDDTAGDALSLALTAHGRIDALVRDADDTTRGS